MLGWSGSGSGSGGEWTDGRRGDGQDGTPHGHRQSAAAAAPGPPRVPASLKNEAPPFCLYRRRSPGTSAATRPPSWPLALHDEPCTIPCCCCCCSAACRFAHLAFYLHSRMKARPANPPLLLRLPACLFLAVGRAGQPCLCSRRGRPTHAHIPVSGRLPSTSTTTRRCLLLKKESHDHLSAHAMSERDN